MNRREFLRTTPAAAAAALALPAQTAGEFTFVHFTDTHIQPELRAAEGCLRCFRKINELKPDFAVAGGDLVFDVLETGPARARELFDLYTKTLGEISVKTHNVIGNHDIYGLFPKSGVGPGDPMYGKKLYEDRLGRRYYSFNHKGWHFIVLDSIGITPEREYIGLIDQEQMAWLAADLEAAGAGTPVIVVTHIPLVTGFPAYGMAPGASTRGMVVTNARAVVALLARYNVKAVLQGHTHVREIVHYAGCQYITSGAVCGNWWRGARMGHPEGFALLRVRGGQVEWSYQTFGFVAEAKG